MKKNSIKNLREKCKLNITKQENYRNREMLKNNKRIEEIISKNNNEDKLIEENISKNDNETNDYEENCNPLYSSRNFRL